MPRKNPALAELGLDSAARRKNQIDSRPDTVKIDGMKADYDAAMEGSCILPDLKYVVAALVWPIDLAGLTLSSQIF